MRFEKMILYSAGHARATSAAAAAVVCVCSVLNGSHAKAVNRVDATGACCAVRAWGVLCVVRVARSHAQEPRARQLFSLTARVCSKKKTAHRAPASACCSSRPSTRRCHRWLHLHPAKPQPHDFAFAVASRWHGLAARVMAFVRYE